jgi:hypothetical protein
MVSLKKWRTIFRPKPKPSRKPSPTAPPVPNSTPVLLRRDIVERVLWHCVDPVLDAYYPLIPIYVPTTSVPIYIRVPSGASWFAKAARTCKAWLEPALRHLYYTVYLHRVQVPKDVFEPIARMIRTLVIHMSPYGDVVEPRIPFRLVNRLSTLIVVGPTLYHPLPQQFDGLVHQIRSCPSLANLTRLVLRFSSWHPSFADLLKPCKNLQRLTFEVPSRLEDGPHEFVAKIPERLQEMTILGYCIDDMLATLGASTHLVVLNMRGSLDGIQWSYRLICQIIKASCRSLRAIGLEVSHLGRENRSSLERQGQSLAKALGSCQSLRFLRLGVLDLIFGCLPLRQLFLYLARLPIRVLSLNDVSTHCTLPLQLPDFLYRFRDLAVFIYSHPDRDVILRLQEKLRRLVFEDYTNDPVWPPIYHKLSPAARAVLDGQPYRASSFSLRDRAANFS